MVVGSAASTMVRERLRMMLSSITVEDVERAVEWRWCAHISNKARS